MRLNLILIYNSSKSYSLCFKHKHVKFDRPCFYFNLLLLEIPRLDQCKHLGILLINTKNCEVDLNRQIRKFDVNFLHEMLMFSSNFLICLFKSTSQCSPDVKCTLFIYFCSIMHCSTMLYLNHWRIEGGQGGTPPPPPKLVKV